MLSGAFSDSQLQYVRQPLSFAIIFQDIFQKPVALAYGYDFNGFFLNAIHDAVIPVNFFPEVFVLAFWDDSTAFRYNGDIFDDLDYSLGKKSGIVLRIFGNIFANLLQVRSCQWRPYNYESHCDNLLSTSLCGIPFPSSNCIKPSST